MRLEAYIMSGPSREEYYAFHPEYYNLQELRRLLMANECRAAIDFIKNKGLNVNSYVSGLRKETWVPLVYLASMSERREELVRYLIVHGADVHLMPDGCAPPILLVCHTKFLQFFIRRGARIDNTEYIRDAVVHGEGHRLRTLMRRNIVSNDMLRMVALQQDGWDGAILSGLKLALTYLFYRYAKVQSNDQKTATEETIKKYRESIILGLECGWQPGMDVLQLCVDYYLYELLELLELLELPGHKPEVIYHTQMDRTLVAMYRPLLNDRRYEETCRVMGQKVDKDVYNTYIGN